MYTIYLSRRWGLSLIISAPHSPSFSTGTPPCPTLQPVDQTPFSEAYLGFEGNELQNHLHGEEASEEHVEDVHGNFEEAALAIVLRGVEGL